ncbi:YbaB/EbfC family nucleoid-associated protein [Nocardia sp. NPDC019395]|uniref:YbaB/EbfC family nucleoid-associated protein n=1 Tax=Nocardia sp. NPDC019395 TaxID=3154686 RepID=UPI0033F50183
MSDGSSRSAADAMESFRREMDLVAELQRQRTQLTASASVRDKRVTVTVNANGLVIATEFSPDIGDLTFDEIATAVTEAVHQAAAEMVRRTEELMRPLREVRAGKPKLSELVDGIPDFESVVPVEPQVSTAAPNAAERVSAQNADAGNDPVLVFDDVVELADHREAGARGPKATESTW